MESRKTTGKLIKNRLNAGILASWLVAASPVNALGLGEISTSSYLGQPLQAALEVTMGPQEAYSADEVRVRQINEREASDLGIFLAGYQQGFQLQPVNRDGKLFIDLKSRNPVNEPFLNLLVELSWPTGKVYREYTLLLDPVVFSAQPASVATSKARGDSNSAASGSTNRRSAPSNNQANKSTPSRSSGPATSAKLDLDPGSNRYQVQSGDTLSRISARLVKNTDTRRGEMMQWLLANNPQAFRNSDINKILAGATLTLPAGKSIAAEPANTSQKIASASKSAYQSAAKTEAERLSIVTPGMSETSILKGQIPKTDNVAVLKSQVVATSEMVDRMRRENETMRKRLEALENSNYVESLERLVALKEQEIKELRVKLDQSESSEPNRAGGLVSAEEGPAEQSEGERNSWLIAMLILALTGASFFFFRWRSREQDELDGVVSAKPKSEPDEDDLLQELDDIVDAQVDFDHFSHQNALEDAAVLTDTKEAFDILGQQTPTHYRRPEDEVKKSIEAKINDYIPKELEEHDKHYHDELDGLISNAIAAANRGNFDEAEAMLSDERIEHNCKTNNITSKVESRIALAQQFIQQLKHSRGSE